MERFLYQNKEYSIGKTKGFFSSYIKLPKNRGMKILHRSRAGFSSEKSLKKSPSWRIAKREFNLLLELSSSQITPMVYEIVAIQSLLNKKWYPAIVMEHIQGVRLSQMYKKSSLYVYKVKSKKFKAQDLRNYLENYMKTKFKVFHRDLHYGNILIQKNRQARVIDLGLANRI